MAARNSVDLTHAGDAAGGEFILQCTHTNRRGLIVRLTLDYYIGINNLSYIITFITIYIVFVIFILNSISYILYLLYWDK